ADPVEPLPGELEVVPLHVDRPAPVADDVDAVLHAGDQALGVRAGRVGGQRHVGHPLDRHVAGGVGERAAVGGAQPPGGGDPAVPLVAGEHPVPDQVEGGRGHALVVEADGGQPVLGGAVPGDVHRRRAVAQAVQPVGGGEGGAGVGGLIAQGAVQLGGVPDALVDG